MTQGAQNLKSQVAALSQEERSLASFEEAAASLDVMTYSKDAALSSSTESSSEIPESVSIYEIESYQAFKRFERFVQGSPNDILLVISSAPIDDRVQKAIESSADKLGAGASRVSWACILGIASQNAAQGEPVPISPKNLHLLIESIDPEAIVAVDVGAMSVISEAYGIELSANSPNRVACRTCAAFTNFASMLDDDDNKQKAWQVLKRLFE